MAHEPCIRPERGCTGRGQTDRAQFQDEGDAPCTGSGAWRRNSEAKWRMRPGALEQRIKDQDDTLESASRFVK
jgi:hypothetical protein